ncbi:hypothetical protein Sste5346_003765 [Sporothrix stenoceras]|uniref:Zn(2)-C6 fungal-type domain-containing protein n=1 Tax=Sporothrix stenoceras TaxID=5173 RepID=A0ABR3ZDL9_9PEZI
MAEPEVRRRRRPAVSCTLCRRRKIRCNREQPCSNCLRARKNVACVYEELPPLPGAAPAAGQLATPPTALSTSSSTASIVNDVTDVSDSGRPRERQPIHNEGIVFRNALHQQTPTSASTSNNSIIDGLQPRPPPTGTSVNSAVFGLTGLTVADISPSGGGGTANASGASGTSGKTSAPTTVPTTAEHSPFDHENVMGLPEFNAYDSAAHEAGQARQARQARQSHHSRRSQHSHSSPEEVQSMQQRIRHLEAQLNVERRQQDNNHPQRQTRDNHRDSHRFHDHHRRDPHDDIPAPNLPHMVVNEAAGDGPMAYLTIEDPPPMSSCSHGGSATLTPGNPLSDRGKHHLCFSNKEFENANNELVDENNNLLTTTNLVAAATAGDRPVTPSVVNWPTKPSSIAGDFFVSTRGKSFGPRERERRMHMTSRSVMHKTRLFGQSHWVNSIVGFRDIFEMIDPLVTDTTASKVFVDMQRLKHMGRIIKALRVGPAWLPPSVGLQESYGLPPRELADELVECYLRSTESVYRILHVPMFRREYEALWQALGAGNPLTKADMAFLVQLKLVLAIGFATHRDHIALRTRAVRWFYAAQAWFAEPEYKAHLTMQVLQIHMLLLFAREATGIGGALIWISVGDLVRSAVYMGLHRDPDRLPKRMSRLAAEMRRRLWNTILELVVASSLDAGGPAMLSVTDFDARPPSNIDDEALEESVLAETAAAKAAANTGNGGAAKASLAATGKHSLQRLSGLESANITVTQKADPRAAPNNWAKEIYVDDGAGMRGVPEPASAAELLEQEKRGDGEWLSSGVGVNKMDRLGDDSNGRLGWQKKVYVEERERERGTSRPREPPPQICVGLRNARDDTPQGLPGDGDEDKKSDKNGGASRSAVANADYSPGAPRPSHKFTSMSVAVALRKTLPLRLAICKFLNDMGLPGTYADTLRLDSQFRMAFRELFDTLQEYNAASKADQPPSPARCTEDDPESAPSPPRPMLDHYAVSVLRLIMRHYLLCLHIPFFGASMQEDKAYAYSRRVVGDTAVRVWHTCCPGIVDTSISTIDAADFAADEARQAQANSSSATPKPGRTFVDPALLRQTMLGAGALRRLAMQASLLVAAEAKFQLVEDDTDTAATPGDPTTGGRAPIRPDLLAIIEAASHWCLRSIEAGETNFKGYLLWRLIEKQLDGMRRGMMAAPTATAASRTNLARELVQGAEEAEQLCMPILEGMMSRGIQEAAASASSTGGGVCGPGTEVHNLIRMCRIEDCSCQSMYRQHLQQQQEQQQQQALEAAQLAEQQQQLQNMSTQAPFMPGIQPSMDPMSMDFTVDNWEFIMPDAQSLNIGSGEPLSWLFNGESTQGILW